MFLQQDEIGSIGYVHINHDISIIKGNDCVEELVMTVKGKADKVPVTLMMWFDHEFPEFCPVQHSLAWLYLSGIKDSFFFPSNNFLCNTVLNHHGMACVMSIYHTMMCWLGGKTFVAV
jgi:hypothetical protein